MAQRLSETDIEQRLKGLSGWSRHGQEITRQYKFSEFVPAMAFVNFVAGEAERLDHHPDILIQYNKVTLTLSTHSAGGLTALDFDLAKKIDA
jgi:4a-hydroxytetrahydrobiopterin dehydratase